MIIDIFIGLLMILCIFAGERQGFIKSLIRTLGWLVSILAALVLRPLLVSFIDEKTSIREEVNTKIVEFVKTKLIANDIGITESGSVPASISSVINSSASRAYNDSAYQTAAPITDAVISAAAFIVIMLAVFVVIWIFLRFFEVLKRDFQPIGALDSIAGMLFGLLKAVLMAYILINVIMIVSSVTMNSVLLSQIEGSICIRTLSDLGLLMISENVFANMASVANNMITSITGTAAQQ